MVAAIRRLPLCAASSEETRNVRTRKTTRHPVSTHAVVSSSGGASARVRLSDISTHGCCLQSEPAALRCGSFVSLRLGEDRPIQGLVRWMRDGATGFEFLRPLTGENREWLSRIVDEDD